MQDSITSNLSHRQASKLIQNEAIQPSSQWHNPAEASVRTERRDSTSIMKTCISKEVLVHCSECDSGWSEKDSRPQRRQAYLKCCRVEPQPNMSSLPPQIYQHALCLIGINQSGTMNLQSSLHYSILRIWKWNETYETWHCRRRQQYWLDVILLCYEALRDSYQSSGSPFEACPRRIGNLIQLSESSWNW